MPKVSKRGLPPARSLRQSCRATEQPFAAEKHEGEGNFSVRWLQIPIMHYVFKGDAEEDANTIRTKKPNRMDTRGLRETGRKQ